MRLDDLCKRRESVRSIFRSNSERNSIIRVCLYCILHHMLKARKVMHPLSCHWYLIGEMPLNSLMYEAR